jgi:hypothetical protein
MNRSEIYGLAAEFEDPTTLLEAAREIKRRGYARFEAYTPYPIKDLDEVIPGWNLVAPIVLMGGFVGAAVAWSMQYYIAAIDYPTNVGGRPLYSWPMFIPILFELTVLFAGCSAFFNLPEFSGATSSRFFLCIEECDPLYDSELTASFLRDLNPIGVWEVENT